MINPFNNRTAQNFIVSLCLIVFSVYLYQYRENIYYLFKKLDWLEAGFVFLSIALQIGIRAWCERLHYNSIGYNISAGALYCVFAKQNILNYLPMKIGTIYSAAILQMHHKISMSHFSAVFAAQNILVLAITLLASSFAILLSYSNKTENYVTAIILAFSAFFVFSVLFFQIPRFKKLPADIKGHIDMVNNSIGKYKTKPKLLAATIILRLIAVLLMTWRFQILLALGGEPVSFSIALVLSSSILISLLVSITPAGLGIREAILGATSGLLMISSGITVIASVFERIFVLVFSALILVMAHMYNIIKSYT